MPNYDNLFIKAHKLLNSGDRGEALTLFVRCSSHKNYKLRCMKIMGDLHAQVADYKKAELCFKKVLKLDPTDYAIWSKLAMSMVFGNGNQNEILFAFKKSIKINSEYAYAWYGAGNVYRDMGNYVEAKVHLKKAIEIDFNQLDARINLATIYRHEGDYCAAIAEYDECLSIQPTKVEAIAAKSLAMFHKGDIEEAEQLILNSVSKHSNNTFVAQAYCEICKRNKYASDALHYINMTLERVDISPVERRDLHYSAARLSDGLDDYGAAFEHAKSANAYGRERFDSSSYISQLDQNKKAATSKIQYAKMPDYNSSVVPIFILGMPRSGSSLIEQILSCHPEITAGGELTNLYTAAAEALKKYKVSDLSQLSSDVLLRIGQQYIDDLEVLATDGKFVTNKLPGNFEIVNLINTIFPFAKIINTNRNKIDVCVSCYFQNFGLRHGYTCDMKTLQSAYEYYDEVLSFWRSNSSISICDANYEDMVFNSKDEISKILNYLDLSWSDECLQHQKSNRLVNTASFDQVRQPIYSSSIGKWKNYEEHIPELISTFGVG